MNRNNLTKKFSSCMKVIAVGALATSIASSYTYEHVSASETSEAANVLTTKKVSNFKDVRADYWAADSIDWASSIGLIKGFPDGEFKPNAFLTEEQFTTMLARFYEDIKKEVDLYTDDNAKRQSDNKYEGLAHFRIPLLGYDDMKFRKNPVNRGLIAQVFAYLQGNKSDLDEAIQFLFDEGITNGSNPTGKTLAEKFGTTDQLTRAHAVAFFKRLHDVGEVAVHPEVIENKLMVDKKNESLLDIAAKVVQAKKEAVAKVDPAVLPDKKEFIAKKQELVALKKQVNEEKKETGKKLNEIGKAIGEAGKAGDLDIKQDLIKEKQDLIKEKQTNGKETGNKFDEIGKAIGEAGKAGDLDKKQDLIKEKQDLIKEKQTNGKETGNKFGEIGKAIGEAGKAGDLDKKQDLIKEKQDLIKEKQTNGKETGNNFGEIGKAIGDANKNGDFGKKQDLIIEKQDLIKEKQNGYKNK